MKGQLSSIESVTGSDSESTDENGQVKSVQDEERAEVICLGL